MIKLMNKKKIFFCQFVEIEKNLCVDAKIQITIDLKQGWKNTLSYF